MSNQKILIDYFRQNIGRYRRELNVWQQARELRYDVDTPLTYALQEVYTDCMVDTHLKAITENRILRIVNLPFQIVKSDGKPDDKLTQLIERPWFTDIIRLAMESIFYGYSLIHLKEIKNHRIKRIEAIPREHIVPEKKWVVYNTTDTSNGFPYAEYPNELLYAQMYDAYGLLEQAAAMTILKRHSWGSWDEFEQMFGIPMRIAKVPSGNTALQKEVSTWLHEMGRSATGVFPLGTDIEIKENSKADAFRVFLEKINSVNSELSKLINGQTMTVDNGSSRSQSEVHQTTQNEITNADKRELIYWLNNTLKPALIAIGYPLTDGHYFNVQDVSNPNEKIKIDAQLLANGYRMTPEYIERIYGVELDKTTAIDLPKKKS